MNGDAISAIGETIGAVAVVISLLYLTIQIRQNTSHIKTSMTFGTVNRRNWVALSVLCTIQSLHLICNSVGRSVNKVRPHQIHFIKGKSCH
jgi:hypothetical protein